MPKVVIVVPCFNEEKRLRPAAFLQALVLRPDLYFLFVDDGSSDRTGALLADMSSAGLGRLQVLSLGRNWGKAEAVRKGFREAMRGDAELIGYWDADLAAPLENLDDLLAAMAEDHMRVVIGSRVRLLGRPMERSPLRHYLGRVFATAASLVLGLQVYDTQCGAKLFRRTPDLDSCFASSFRSRWLFDVEILARLRDLSNDKDNGGQPRGWAEVPLREWHHVPASKLRLAAFVRAPFELARIALRRRPPS